MVAVDRVGKWTSTASALSVERERLRAEVSHLAAAERSLGEAQRAEGGPAGDLADIASDVAEQEMIDALGRRVIARLDQIDRALDRLRAQSYGACEDCGEPIDPARLRALPWARRCLRCQRRAELGGRPPLRGAS